MTTVKAALGPIGILDAYADEQLVDRMGIELVHCAPELVIGRMPVAGNRQPIGLLHGGANAVLAETLGSVAALLHAGDGGVALGLELSCIHHRPARGGIVTGVCRPLHRGENNASYQVVITDEQGNRTCTATLTCVLRTANSAPA